MYLLASVRVELGKNQFIWHFYNLQVNSKKNSHFVSKLLEKLPRLCIYCLYVVICCKLVFKNLLFKCDFMTSRAKKKYKL